MYKVVFVFFLLQFFSVNKVLCILCFNPFCILLFLLLLLLLLLLLIIIIIIIIIVVVVICRDEMLRTLCIIYMYIQLYSPEGSRIRKTVLN